MKRLLKGCEPYGIEKPSKYRRRERNYRWIKVPIEKKKMTPEEQSAQFIKTALELECDESEKAFYDKLGKLMKDKAGKNEKLD